MGVKCFFLEPIGKIRRHLRRYSGGETTCPSQNMGHNAMVYLDEIEDENIYARRSLDGEWSHEDERWPKTCSCGYFFEEKDEWQVFTQSLYRRGDNGEITTLREAQPGAMWFADWMLPHYVGPDGHCLVVKLPNGNDWMVDADATNCTMKEDKVHKCWVRHGEIPNITVDKNGFTCAAGAGSIQSGDWHGFLRNGELVL